MLTDKELFALIAIVLTMTGYIPYIRDTLRGKTKPHAYTWFLWSFIALIVSGVQLSTGAGAGAYVTMAAAFICFIIFLISLKNRKHVIKTSDALFLVAGLIAIGIWLFAKQPLVSVVLLIAIELFGFGPTVRKAWSKPYTETLLSYQINVIRFCLAFAALGEYSLVTVLYPLASIASNAAICCLLVVRRQRLPRRRTA